MIRNLSEIITDGELNIVRYFIYLSWILILTFGFCAGYSLSKYGVITI